MARDARPLRDERLPRPLRRGAVALAPCLLHAAPAPAGPAVARDAGPDPLGEVTRQQGPVTALLDRVPRALHVGAAVSRGDRVVTGDDARVLIAFHDGSTLSLGSGTTVEIVDYSPETRRGGLQLLLGIVRTSLSELWGGGFRVGTRAAVASVRSTDWIVEAGAGRSSVFVVAGEVAVRGTADGATVRLSAGEGTDVPNGGTPSPPAAWGDARVRDVLARTRVP